MFEERPRRQQLSDLRWRDCDCQGWTPATWSVETRDCTRNREGMRASVVLWSTTFDIEKAYTVAVPTWNPLWVNWDHPFWGTSWSQTLWALTWSWCDWASLSEESCLKRRESSLRNWGKTIEYLLGLLTGNGYVLGNVIVTITLLVT